MPIDQPLFWAYVFFWSFATAYGLYFFSAATGFRFKQPKETSYPPVSVIVSAKNEARNLKKLIPRLLELDYPDYEIVLIDDRSTDGTADIIRAFADNHPGKIKPVIVPFQEWKSFIGNKKFALTLGIKAAKNEFLLFTDADCIPASKQWIQYMTSGLRNKQIVLGYGKYDKQKTFLNALIRYETLLTGLQYTGMALRKMPYMGVGRNLAYRKSFFFEKNGFQSHFNIPSGDDDLFVNANADGTNTAVCLHPSAHTVSHPKEKWIDWINQKRRHYGTAVHYRFIHRVLLSLFPISRLAVYLSGIGILLLNFRYFSIWIPAIFYMSVHTFFVWKTGRKWQDTLPFYLIIPLDLILIPLQMVIFAWQLVQKPVRWK